MEHFKCEEIIKNIATNVYLLKIDSDKGELLELKFIHHTPWSKWGQKYLEENPKNLISLILKEDLPNAINALKELKYKDHVSFVYRFYSKDGKINYINPNIGVIKRDGNIVYAVGYSERVNEREELKNIAKNLFSYNDIGILIYQEKVVFVNDYIKRNFGFKKEDDIFDILSYDEKLVKAMKKRLQGDRFETYYPYYPLIINSQRIFADIFATTIIYDGKYSGFVILLNKTLIVKKDIFLKILNKIYDTYLESKNELKFLENVVGIIESQGYKCEIDIENVKIGDIGLVNSFFQKDSKHFTLRIGSFYKNEFEGLEEVLEELGVVVHNSFVSLIDKKNLILLKNSFDESFQAVVITDENLNILYSNKIFKEWLGVKEGNLLEVFKNIEVSDSIVKKILIPFSKKVSFLKTKIIPIFYDKKYYVFQGIIIDNKADIVDNITSLLNRKGFLEQKSIKQKAVILVDIYEFKSIVESKGKGYANKVLKKLGKFLKDESVMIERVSRVGGDEFAFLIELKNYKELSSFVKDLIKRINKFLNLNVNIGVAISENEFRNLEILLEKAYIALHHAVKKGVNTFEIYNDNLSLEKKKFFTAQILIKEAIDNEKLIFYFQPYVKSSDFKIAGAESLLRIKKDNRIVPPIEFIDVAEESGLISEIEEITFPMILEYAKKVDINLSYNLSAYSFFNKNFYEKIPEINNLIIEITERIVSDIQIAKEKINLLKQKGIKVSIDDFGTGYSNFMFLKELNFDVLKIDMSFIKNIEKSKKDRAIVKSIIDFATTVGLKSVAEGVENENQIDILKEFGCDYFQGYYFYKPMPFEELQDLLRSGK